MSSCNHQGKPNHWEKGELIRNEKNNEGKVIGKWYKWYHQCDACGTQYEFESRLE